MNAHVTPAGEEFTVDSVRAMALRQAKAWNDNEDGLCDTSSLMDWRDNCRDEVRDFAQRTKDESAIVRAWGDTFDGAVRDISDAVDGIECAIETVNDLLRLALDQLAGVTDNRADAAIRGAQRFIDDIGEVAIRLQALTGYRSGGAA